MMDGSYLPYFLACLGLCHGEGNPSIVVYSSTGRLPDVGIRRYSAASGYGTVRAGV